MLTSFLPDESTCSLSCHSTLCVCECENERDCFLGCFFFPPILCVCACVRACACVHVRVCVLLSSEQSSGNVWVTHEEMENLASSTKAVSTIWAVSPLLHPTCTPQPLYNIHLTLSHSSTTVLTPITTVIH